MLAELKNMDFEDWVELISGLFVIGLLIVIAGGMLDLFSSAFTMHNRHDVRSAIVQEINNPDGMFEYATDGDVQDSDLIILEFKNSTMMFVMDETVFASEYTFDDNKFGDNDIFVQSIQQIKHEVNIGGSD